ncbi:MAG: helix-turn-helix domain-containing protein [Chloroflexi bacterium]|nr:helix-turn-helix domain-containing protein [Chloroflexota bacterium]
MKDKLFEALLTSVREGGAILRGEKEASRQFVIDTSDHGCAGIRDHSEKEAARQFVIDTPDVKQIRERYKLSQTEFAALMGISVKTLQNWEQGRRTPRGAARVLLQVADKHPEAVWDVVQPAVL